MPHGIRNHEKTVSGAGGEPATVKTDKIYLDPGPLRYSGKSNWEQYREKFETIVCSNGWDKVTAALQLLSHLDGDALNVALLVPESQRAVPEFLINSWSDHYNSPGRRAEYKRQFQRVVRRPEDDPSVFAIELETLARSAFTDIDSSIQRQMVRDRFIDGQAECALHRNLDSLIPDTPMSDIVDSCRVWESHRDVETEPGISSNRRPVHVICQVAVDEQIRTPLPEKESLEEIISKLLPTPAPPKTRKDPIPSDRDLLVQRLSGTLAPSIPVVRERSAVTDLETMLQSWLPVGTVKEVMVVSRRASTVSADGCFSCGISTHTIENCRTLDESFPFLPIGWRAERVGDEFILGPGGPVGPEDHEMGNDDWSGERGWSPGPAMPTDPNSCHLGTSRLENPEDTRKRSWEHVDSFHYPDSEESEDDIVDTDECENGLVLINLRNEVMHPMW